MQQYFADLHVHIGRSSNGRLIKMGTSANLTFENIVREAICRKGIQVIGIVDCISPWIITDIDNLLKAGDLDELPDGGMIYKNDLLILPGAEIETHEPGGGSAHCLVFFCHFSDVKKFSRMMAAYMKDLRRNTTMSHLTARQLFDIVDSMGGVLIPAHVFTPYKSFYGNCTDRLVDVFGEDAFCKIPSIELGLSADTNMACRLSELDGKSFLSNSDAHSLSKIGREYTVFKMEKLSYGEVLKALRNEDGRGIVANYGLDPGLGKYNRTFCRDCRKVASDPPPVLRCSNDSEHRVVVGVADRLEVIADRRDYCAINRPPYYYQVPLEFLPGVGPATVQKLINAFGNEMNVLHRATFEELALVVPERVAEMIIKARQGRLRIAHGGGGIYGKVSAV